MGPGGLGERHVDVEGPTDSERRFNKALAFSPFDRVKAAHWGLTSPFRRNYPTARQDKGVKKHTLVRNKSSLHIFAH